MKTYTIITDTGVRYTYEFETAPSKDQLDTAMDGIGGRPPDKKPPQ